MELEEVGGGMEGYVMGGWMGEGSDHLFVQPLRLTSLDSIRMDFV
jgi:hypothetical protein